MQGGETLAALFADADYFVFPSSTDTFGNVVVESLASGTPALVTDQGGPQDIVGQNGCGWVLPFNQTKPWLDQLNACCELKLQHPEAFATMREQAYKRSQDYTLDQAVQAQWEFFRQVVNGNP